MMLLLSTFRRLTIMHNYSINGRWSEGRPLLSNYPRLMGQTLGFVSFGHVARATAVRAKAFGLRMLAYDPYIEEINMTRYDVEPVGLFELLDDVALPAVVISNIFSCQIQFIRTWLFDSPRVHPK